MEIGKQIKKYRSEFNFSQEELAEKVYVSRQTISNWENDKNYPDIKSLLLLSTVFEVSLDTLVKGDLDDMREKIKTREVNQQDYEKFMRDGRILGALFLYSIFLTLPIINNLGKIGLVLGIGIWVITFYYASRVDKIKKIYDIKTYKEIIAFMEKENLNEVEKYIEKGKSKYQKFMLVIASAILGALAALGTFYLFKESTLPNMTWGYKFIVVAQAINVFLLIDYTYDKIKIKQKIKLNIYCIVFVFIHLLFTAFVGLGLLNIRSITYCVISLIWLLWICIMMFLDNKNKNHFKSHFKN